MTKETNSKNYLPPFLNTNTILYNPAEIEHPLFRYDQRCIGIIALYTARKLNTDYIGTVELDGVKIHHSFFLHPDDANMPEDQDILCIPVRGRIQYGSTHALLLSGFRDAEDNLTENMLLHVKAEPKTAFQKDPRTTHEDHVALQAAREGIVLLQNTDHILPMPSHETLNLFGSGWVNFRTHTFRNDVMGRVQPSLIDTIEASSFTLNEELYDFFKIPNDRTPNRQIFQRAKYQSDYGIMIISRPSLRGRDVRPIAGEYYLSAEEDALLRMICHFFPKTIVILNTPYPIHLGWMRKYDVKGLLYVGMPGQAGPQALLDILSGTVCPSGRLTDTWCFEYENYPAALNFYDGEPVSHNDNVWTQTCYEEGIYTGYRYFSTFTEARKNVAYPFGFGLSYTTFTITPGFFNPSNRVLNITVKNVGKVPGKEVVQVYVSFPSTMQDHPVHQLVAFQKTSELDPDQSQVLTVRIPLRNLSTFVSAQNAWFLEAGDYRLFVGNTSDDLIPAASYTNEVPRMLKQMLYHIQTPIPFHPLHPGEKNQVEGNLTKTLSKDTAMRLKLQLQRENNLQLNHGANQSIAPVQQNLTFQDVQQNPSLLPAFVEQMDLSELTDLLIGHKPQLSVTERNHLITLPGSKRLGTPDIAFCPGNAGIANHFPTVCMPASINLGQTFNRNLMEEIGYCIGLEAQRAGINIVEDTEANMHRIPLAGSNADSFSEDPYLTGIMLAYKIRGLHNADVKSCVGHVLCANSETSLGNRIVLADERTLRELYLRPFDILFREEKPDALLASSTIVNHHMCGSYRILLEGILRKELGFQGFIITGTSDVAIQGVNSLMTGVSCVVVDQREQYNLLKKEIETAIENGSLSKTVLHILVKRLLSSLK